MKLDSLILENYRCFESLKLALYLNMTVLVAENGQGKFVFQKSRKKTKLRCPTRANKFGTALFLR